MALRCRWHERGDVWCVFSVYRCSYTSRRCC